MQYIEVSIETAESGVEIVLGKLIAMGIDSAEIIDPEDIREISSDKKKYAWDYFDETLLENADRNPEIRCYFPADEQGVGQAKRVRAGIEELRCVRDVGGFGSAIDLGPLKVQISRQDDSEWKDKWKEFFKPARIGEKIVVSPSWENYRGKDGELVIEIDPGMAFGTGTHETTSMCVRLLEEYLHPGDEVLDAGCGSGILSIASALLGAEKVQGVDIDPEAVRVSEENFVLNHVESVCHAEYGDLTEGVDFCGDIIAGNLMAELICQLASSIRKHLKRGGIFIGSGILTEKENAVMNALETAGFVIEKKLQDGEWSAVAARKDAQ